MFNNERGSNIVSLSEHRSAIEALKTEFRDLYDDLISKGYLVKEL